MGTMASQITGVSIVYWTVFSDADQRRDQSSASLAFVRGIHRWPHSASHCFVPGKRRCVWLFSMGFESTGNSAEVASLCLKHRSGVLFLNEARVSLKWESIQLHIFILLQFYLQFYLSIIMIHLCFLVTLTQQLNTGSQYPTKYEVEWSFAWIMLKLI